MSDSGYFTMSDSEPTLFTPPDTAATPINTRKHSRPSSSPSVTPLSSNKYKRTKSKSSILELPLTVWMRLASMLRKDGQCKTLATLMRCSSSLYEIIGLKLYEHIEIDDTSVPKLLYGEAREFASSSDLQKLKSRKLPMKFGSNTGFPFQPSLPSLSATISPLYPKYKTPQQRKMALLSFAKTLHLTSLPIQSHETLLSALTYPNRTLFPQLQSLCLGIPRYRQEQNREVFADILRKRSKIPPGILMTLRLLNPKRLCVREQSCEVTHQILREFQRKDLEPDLEFSTHRLESCAIYPRTIGGLSCRHGPRISHAVLSIPGVETVYDASGCRTTAKTAEYIVATLLSSRRSPSSTYDFVDMPHFTEESHPLEVEEAERDMVKGVKRQLGDYVKDTSWLSELDGRVRFWFGRDYGKHKCCGYEAEEGFARRTLQSEERRYLMLSDVPDES